MKKKLLFTYLSLGIFGIIGISFGSYIISSNEIKEDILINVSDINVNEQKYELLYRNSENTLINLQTFNDDGNILTDVFQIGLYFDNNFYNLGSSYETIYLGIEIEISLTSKDLFEYIRDNRYVNFVYLSYKKNNEQFYTSMKSGNMSQYKMISSSEYFDCIQYNIVDTNLYEIKIHVPVAVDCSKSSDDFYVYNLIKQSKNSSLTGNSFGDSKGIGEILICLDFAFVDNLLGYSNLFKTSDFDGFNVNISVESYS